MPNDWIAFSQPPNATPMQGTSNGSAAGKGRTASEVQDEQAGMKKARHNLLAMPRLSK